jgi:DNA-binding transcriptional regulator YiaG
MKTIILTHSAARDLDGLPAAAREMIEEGLAALEEADDIAMFDERIAALQSGADAALPAEVTVAMLRGETLLRAIRGWRKLTQQEVAKRTGLAQCFVSDLEQGRKTGSDQTLKSLAEALDVDPRWLGAG